MKVDSESFKKREKIPVKYTFDGEDINPELTITEIPSDAKSLVLIVDDPDAERVCGHTWVHWVRFNIPFSGSELRIEENSLPGISGLSTYKKPEYGGPNPPAGSGVHNYFFKVYALDKKLDLPEMSSLDEITAAMNGHVIELYELIGQYWRD